LTESTVQNFKKAYKEAFESELEKPNPQPICKIPCQPQGRPPILLEIDKAAESFSSKRLCC